MTRLNISENITIYNDDCLNILPLLEDKSVGLVLTDPPYGTTGCRWDSIIPLDALWKDLERLIPDDRAFVLFSQQPFTTKLISSNYNLYKYNWVWEKSKATNFHNSKNSPMKKTEDICVFSKGTTANCSPRRMIYYPQGLIPFNKIVGGKRDLDADKKSHNFARPSNKKEYLKEFTNYPHNILEFASVSKPTHPTQKPVPLLEYLIKTYSDEGDTVLDFTAGSFSTAIACINTNRKFIGIEQDETYFKLGKERIEASLLEQTNINNFNF